MLKKRHASSTLMVNNEFIGPFLPLVKDVKSRIHALEKDYKACIKYKDGLKEIDENCDDFSLVEYGDNEDLDRKSTDDYSDSYEKLGELKLKLGLWRRLYRSIETVLVRH